LFDHFGNGLIRTTDPENLGIDTIFILLSHIYSELWPKNGISVTAALICILAAILCLALPKLIETHSIIFLWWRNIKRHKKYISGCNNKENMVISIISILTAAILGAILNSAKCLRVPGWHHSDSGYVARDDLQTVEKHLTYQSARFTSGRPDYKQNF